MIKSFIWTLIFWSLFVLFNTVGDAILFYSVFPWYKNMDLWHWIKAIWMLWLFLTGVFAVRLYDKVTFTLTFDRALGVQDGKDYMRTALLLFFLLWRWGLHEACMKIWRQ